jgi:hypothetical protein
MFLISLVCFQFMALLITFGVGLRITRLLIEISDLRERLERLLLAPTKK